MTKLEPPPALNPKALKFYREKKKFSQQGLADESVAIKSPISRSQIQRWERGEQTANIRPNSRKALERVLGVRWEELTRPLEKRTDESTRTAELKMGVRRSTLTALELVRMIYRVSWEDIVELAPLLFLLTAQTSLERRKKVLQEAESCIEKAMEDARARAPYLLFSLSIATDDSYRDEEDAIAERKVFDTYDGEVYRSHYVDYLITLLDDLPDGVIKDITGKPIKDISPDYFGGAPKYEFSDVLLGQALHKLIPSIDSLVDSGERFDQLISMIETGRLDLRTLSENHRKLSEEKFKEWIACELDGCAKPKGSDDIFDISPEEVEMVVEEHRKAAVRRREAQKHSL